MSKNTAFKASSISPTIVIDRKIEKLQVKLGKMDKKVVALKIEMEKVFKRKDDINVEMDLLDQERTIKLQRIRA